MPRGDEDRPAAAVQSVDRALLVLEIIAAAGQAGVTEIAAELGVHKSTVSRLIAALEARGYVEQVTGRGKYRLGFSITRLARAGGAQLDLVKVSQDVCDDLCAELGETTNLAILDEDRIVNIVEAIGPAEIALQTWVGQNCPAHATSSGKVLLAGLDDSELADRVAPTLTTFTHTTITTITELRAELARVRTRGWASVCEELEVGLNAVAAPVRDADAKVVAALSVSGPSYRLGEARFDEAAKLTVAAADSISRRLGWVERG
ncbi:IclR family transcriptional regulator [Mycolicibacterium flavescens]|uniref:Glycerol operon regulatory protein n=1 Tax=Mycolicibacterium flavescens TaxID=1776 RepID=A0A1E3RKE8_MYCFV|nr:IclR family transcriptional regulator [Mycolicibacterium flavescens]MCV7281027.1 IclR family transcriptional regulator [Mycolicibacterium flavescens]ODQ90328.1 IclR family transcriptional regulator [Mycolicibacterium flavescens]